MVIHVWPDAVYTRIYRLSESKDIKHIFQNQHAHNTILRDNTLLDNLNTAVHV